MQQYTTKKKKAFGASDLFGIFCSLHYIFLVSDINAFAVIFCFTSQFDKVALKWWEKENY